MTANVSDYDVAGIISQSPWFQGLPEKALSRLVEVARIRTFLQGVTPSMPCQYRWHGALLIGWQLIHLLLEHPLNRYEVTSAHASISRTARLERFGGFSGSSACFGNASVTFPACLLFY